MSKFLEITISASKPPCTLSTIPQKDLTFKIVKGSNQESQEVITLTNSTDEWTAFKIRSTHRHRYLAKPSLGLVGPHDTAKITIAMSSAHTPQSEIEASSSKDRFVLQTNALKSPIELEDLAAYWVAVNQQHNPKHEIFACHEDYFKCKFVFVQDDPVEGDALMKANEQTEKVVIDREQLTEFERKAKEYEKVIKRSVQLTIQLENYEQSIASLKSSNEMLSKEIDLLRSRPFPENFRKEAMSSSLRHLAPIDNEIKTPKTDQSSPDRLVDHFQKHPLYRLDDQEMLQSKVHTSSGLSLTALIAVALIAFVLGKFM